ncbi:hypothetical protein HGRIS_004852 [Hohenbuehelia grisea]|uniref:Uncharacterized protein n=1 Tax=Hohenbuehelia grisea TaxID=104357 RepID=A0ABR3JDD8_9AGAR
MRLSGIFKSIMHRRTKSCSAAMQVIPVVHETRDRPASIDGKPPAGPTIDFKGYAEAHAKQPSRNFDSYAHQRIKSLEQQLAEATENAGRLAGEVQVALEELSAARADYCAEKSRHVGVKRHLAATVEAMGTLEIRLAHVDRFASLMIDLGLHEPVLARAKESLGSECRLQIDTDSIDTKSAGISHSGLDADEALVDAIKDAAAVAGSPWARIVDAVNGPRTAEEYLSAINMTISTRRALRDSKKVAQFWKCLAKEDATHANTVTPSVSTISSVHEPLPEERQNAVDELLDRVRNAEPPYNRVTLGGGLRAGRPEWVQGPRDVRVISRIAEPSGSSSSVRLRDVQSLSDSALAPLASLSFREELRASRSDKLFKSSSSVSPSHGSLEISITTEHIRINEPAQGVITHMSSRASIEALGQIRPSLSQSTDSLANRLLVPVSDTFTKTLSAQLLSADTTAVNASHREVRAARARLSGGSQPFDNSAFSNIAPDILSKDAMAATCATDPAGLPSSNSSGALTSEISRYDRNRPEPSGTNDASSLSTRALHSLERICSTLPSTSSIDYAESYPASLATISEHTEPDEGESSTNGSEIGPSFNHRDSLGHRRSFYEASQPHSDGSIEAGLTALHPTTSGQPVGAMPTALVNSAHPTASPQKSRHHSRLPMLKGPRQSIVAPPQLSPTRVKPEPPSVPSPPRATTQLRKAHAQPQNYSSVRQATVSSSLKSSNQNTIPSNTTTSSAAIMTNRTNQIPNPQPVTSPKKSILKPASVSSPSKVPPQKTRRLSLIPRTSLEGAKSVGLSSKTKENVKERVKEIERKAKGSSAGNASQLMDRGKRVIRGLSKVIA